MQATGEAASACADQQNKCISNDQSFGSVIMTSGVKFPKAGKHRHLLSMHINTGGNGIYYVEILTSSILALYGAWSKRLEQHQWASLRLTQAGRSHS